LHSELPQLDLRAALNDAQYQAVTSNSRALIVLAGAGSGKTRVITYRLAYLLSQGVPPFQVLAVTFTNKAAGEMKARIERLVGPEARRLWVSTFHSACARLLRREFHHFGRASNFAIYDTSDSESVLRECLKELNLSAKECPPAALRDSISYFKSHLLNPQQAAEALSDRSTEEPQDELVARVYPLYEQRLQAANALDFDDLLLYPLRLFREHPETLEKYRARFRHLLVDEYQDTNRAQYEFTRLLGTGADSVCVVGDDDQSIYRWRGALPENLEQFRQDFAPVEVVHLETNYRSTASILAGATAVVNRNQRRQPKRLVTEKAAGEPIHLLASADGEAEAETIIGLIERWTRESREFRLSDCAIFFRTAAQSRLLEEVLVRRGIPYTLVGGIRFYERKEIKDILAYLRASSSPRDEQAWRRIAGLGHWSVGPKTLDDVFTLSRRFEKSPIELSEEELASGLTARGAKPFARLQRTLTGWAQALNRNETTLAEWVTRVIRESHYMEKLAAQTKDREAKRQLENVRDNLGQLISAAQEFTEQIEATLGAEPEARTLARRLELFLAQASLMADIDYWRSRPEPQEAESADIDPGRVVLMTLHSAKGLEFPAVFIVGCEEELFPHSRSLREPEGLEEERRLCYVGMTRAKQRLVLSYAYSRKVFGYNAMRLPSRFLKEIPAKYVQKLGVQTPPAEQPDVDFQAGDLVSHSVFGRGRIVRVSGRGAGLKVRVEFFQHGPKTLMQAYAKMRKL